jgi:hypothetical protein
MIRSAAAHGDPFRIIADHSFGPGCERRAASANH